ncbi:hypothetical protein M885DRAFT_549776 [Pelagophyceae sp. CCMP2097]|nr:hypothetical protein M885DRAFT_549776 [Pelagophyceae sp. CCMP2097]
MLRHAAGRIGRGAAGLRALSTPAVATPGTVVVVPPPTSMTTQQALASSRITLDFLKFGVSGQRLDLLSTDADMDVRDKWTRALQVVVAAQAHCANAFGYQPSSDGVMHYRLHLSAAAQAASRDVISELREYDSEVWSEVLLRAFGTSPRKIEIADARELVARVAAEVQMKDVAVVIKDRVVAIPANDEGHQATAFAIAHRSVADVMYKLAPEYGFVGDEGYALLQAALIEHTSDPSIAHSTQAAMHAICMHAGIKVPY